MNVAELHKKLIAAAKSNPPGEQVPYAFEKRVLAHLRNLPVMDDWGQWAGALWRAAVPCVAIMLLLSAWSFLGTPQYTGSNDLSQAIENTVLAAANQDQAAEISW